MQKYVIKKGKSKTVITIIQIIFLVVLCYVIMEIANGK